MMTMEQRIDYQANPKTPCSMGKVAVNAGRRIEALAARGEGVTAVQLIVMGGQVAIVVNGGKLEKIGTVT